MVVRRRAAAITILGLLALYAAWTTGSTSVHRENTPSFVQNPPETYNLDIEKEDRDSKLPTKYAPSETSHTGTLNPTEVEQSGFLATGSTYARTDNSFNTNTTLGIDTTNGWVASEATAEVWNLERRYAINGTFDDGVPGQYIVVNETPVYYPYGWTASNVSTDPDSEQAQVAGYDDNGFVMVENQGKKKGSSGKQYDHLAGTKTLWKQNISNIPYTKNFTLNFRYLYSRGPLGASTPGDCSLSLFINGSVYWSQSLPDVTARGIWIESGDIPINISDAGPGLEFSIGLVIDETMNLNADEAYANTIANAFYITAYLDDISFVGLNPPSFEEVDFNFHAGNETTPVTGTSGNGTASIPKGDYWSVEQLDIAFTSNVSVSFNYDAYLLEHRFLNSSSTTNTHEFGVQYSVYYNQSVSLDMFTYVGTQGEYLDFNVTIRYPTDWENATVYSPFSIDVTAQCEIVVGRVLIPTILLDDLGWWEVSFQSPNYAESLKAQLFDDSMGWMDAQLFRPGNITRASVEIGTELETPSISNPVNLTWYLPNGTIWWYQSTTSGIAGSLNSSSVAFGPTNTTAGLWSIEIVWSNGTEVAYSSVSFALYHVANLTPVYSLIEGDVGEVVTNVLRFEDIYTGEYLMADDASIVGNWSGSSVNFIPNVVKNWWEGDFNTSVVGGGNFTILVNASKPFYDNTNCLFEISSIFSTQMQTDAPSEVPAEITFGGLYLVNITYRFSNGTGIENATISVDYSGPTAGLDIDAPTAQGAGVYQLAITGQQTGTYIISIEASKDFYHTQTDSFTLEVSEAPTTLIQLNGTSDSVKYGQDYRYVVKYENSSGIGLEGADIGISSIDPSVGLGYGSTSEIGGGYYSILLSPTDTSTFTIVFKANLSNHQTRFVTFTLTVSTVPTTLTLNATSETISVQENLVLGLTFVDDSGSGIPGATITAQNPPADLDISSATDYGDGNYSLLIDPIYFGTYLLTFSASKEHYQNGVASFSLVVEEVGTSLLRPNGTADSVVFGQAYNLVVRYINSSGYGILGADVSVSSVSPETGLDINTTQEIADGYYSLLLNATVTDTYNLVIEANFTNHQIQYVSFTLTVTDVPTTLFLNATSETISVQENLVLGLTFVDDSGSGIPGATITAQNPPADLDISSVTDYGDGNYSLVIDPLYFGTYLLTFSASKPNHQTAASSFSLIVDAVGTSLLRPNGSAQSIVFGEDYNLVVRYVNSSGQGIDFANISVIQTSPETGLDIGTTQEEGDGFYSLLLSPSLTDTYNLVIEANFTNHKVQYVTFTLTVNEIPTSLFLNVSSITISVNDQLVLGMVFEDEGGAGIAGAGINPESPPTELSFSSVTDYGDGNYSLVIDPIYFGNYLLTFSASKTNYLTGYDSFSLTVDEVNTVLLRQNGTADSIKFGESYNLVMRYENSSGHGIDNASVSVSSISPEEGLDIGVADYHGDGYYSILLTPIYADTYTLVIKANLTNHKVQFVTFSLTISEIPTSLTPSPSSATIAVDLMQTVLLTFVDEDSNDIEGATITVLNLPDGLTVSQIDEVGNGVYSVILDPDDVGTYSVSLRASLANYQNSTVGFSLTVREIPTDLIFIGNDAKASVNFSDLFALELIYARTDLGENITGAIINITLSQENGPDFTLETLGELYVISFDTSVTGSWTITIEARKENHEKKSREFQLFIEDVETSITEITLQDELLYDHTYSFDYYYLIDWNNTGIDQADVTVSGIDTDWAQIIPKGDGRYTISLTPTSLGRHSVVFLFDKPGYVSQRTTLRFEVEQVIIGIEILSELSDIAESSKTIELGIYEIESGNPVLNATTTYLIIGLESGLLEQGVFAEGEGGIYRATFTMPPVGNEEYNLEVTVNKPNHVLGSSFGIYSLNPYLSQDQIMGQFIQTYVVPPAILIVGLIIAYVGHILYQRRKRSQIIKQNIVKNIFKDAQNLLGALILHRKSGVPLYSRIIKGGLDETVISAFITAITQFKAEFELETIGDEYDVTPISDLIRIVPTRNLICAFIVLREPSDRQKQMMKEFARQVGFIWDDIYQDTPSEILDSASKRQFDELFDELLDGQLLKTHQIVNENELPRRMKCVQEGLDRIDEEEFELRDLAQGITACGLEEGKAYTVIMDALQNNVIVAKDDKSSSNG